MKLKRVLLSAIVFFAMSSQLPAAEPQWGQWRGPNFDGSSDAKDLPSSIDPDKATWTTQLPGVGNSSPVVFGDRVYVSCVDNSGKLAGMCLAKSDGHILWQQQVGVGTAKNGQGNNAASPSPVTDGKSVFFYFSTGDLAAFDTEGKQLWARNLQKDYGPFNILWIYSSSPLLYKGKLYVQVIHRNIPSHGIEGGNGGVDSYLLALDPANGQQIFKVARPSEAFGESRESYATPTPFEHDGKSMIVLVGGDCVTCHDAETGKELWRAGGWNPQKIAHWRLVPSVCVDAADGLVFACAPKNGPVMAIHDGGSGDVTATGFAWKSDPHASGVSSDVCVPLFYKSNLYLLNGDNKKLYCIDPPSGKVKATLELGGGAVFRSSPTGADGKIYCMNDNGEFWVVDADALKVISQASFNARPSRGAIAVADGFVLVHSGEKIFAFKK